MVYFSTLITVDSQLSNSSFNILVLLSDSCVFSVSKLEQVNLLSDDWNEEWMWVWLDLHKALIISIDFGIRSFSWRGALWSITDICFSRPTGVFHLWRLQVWSTTCLIPRRFLIVNVEFLPSDSFKSDFLSIILLYLTLLSGNVWGTGISKHLKSFISDIRVGRIGLLF